MNDFGLTSSSNQSDNKLKYTLMQQDIPVLEFLIDGDTFSKIEIIKVYQLERVPFMVCSNEQTAQEIVKNCSDDLFQWLNQRLIPSSRMNREILEGLLGYSLFELIFHNQAHSLADHYWIKPFSEPISYQDTNYFDHNFSTDIGDILFGFIIESLNIQSPDNVTDGLLQKKWKINGDKKILVKGGSKRINEPLNEKIASVIAGHLELNYTPYTLEVIEKNIYSICDNFLQEADGSSHKEYVTAHAIKKYFKDETSQNEEAYENLIQHYTDLGIIDARAKLEEMIVLDYVIGNTDRHYNNFGLIRDVNTLKFIDVAPLFDNGTSFYWECYEDSQVDLLQYKSFHTNANDNLKMVTDLERYQNINLPEIIQEVTQLLNKYQLKHDIGLFALRERLLRIKKGS